MTSKPLPIQIDRLVRSRRKSIALIVELDGSLTVRAPQSMPRRQIDALVQKKATWINEKQQGAALARQAHGVKTFDSGELFWYLGEQFPLAIVAPPAPPLVLDGSFRLSRSVLPEAQVVFSRWYRQQARRVLAERVKVQADRLGLQYSRMRITGARTRWGSCSAKKSLNFTWRLVMAPLPVIDYVVVHELCHLVEANHSRAFWEAVEAALPDYQEKRAWLRIHGPGLDLRRTARA